MPDYSKGKIYKIEPIIEHEEQDVYYGSTTRTLSQRMANHRYNPLCSSKYLFQKYGVDNCKISIVETCNVKTKEELNLRESYYIQNNKCINRCTPLLSEKQLKNRRHEYYKQNKEYYNKKNKEWSEKNKERHKELNHLNYLKNREAILLRRKNKYESQKKNL
jgi:hypothetical protein